MTDGLVLRPDDPQLVQTATAQADAARADVSAWVNANAGAGKTKVLVDRFVNLIREREEPGAVLAITYTKAAAAEMRERLGAKLSRWSLAPDAALAGDLGLDPGAEADSETLARARRLFAETLDAPGGLKIQTIHAFCERLLRRFPLEAGAPPGFQVMDDAAAETLQREIEARLGAEAAREPESALGEAWAVLAGVYAADEFSKLFGSIMGERAMLEAALRNGVEAAYTASAQALGVPEGAGADTIVQAAWEEARKDLHPRLREAVPIFDRGGKREQGKAEQLRQVLAAEDAGAWWAALQDLVYDAQGNLRSFNTLTKAIADQGWVLDLLAPEGEAVAFCERVRGRINAAASLQRTQSVLVLADRVLPLADQIKRRRGLLDFDDLIRLSAALLRDSDAADWVRFKLDQAIRHVLLDEAQDTSPEQWALIEPIVREFFVGRGAHENEAPRTQFVVGDEKQSIYSFQGADPERFLLERAKFEERAAAHGAAITPSLTLSFRSSPEVLHAVDAVFGALPEAERAAFRAQTQPPMAAPPISAPEIKRADRAAPETKFAPTEPDEARSMKHQAFRAGQAGLVELWAPVGKPAKQEGNAWDKPLDAASEASAEVRLAKSIAAAVAHWIETGEAVWDPEERTLRPMRWGDVLILVSKRRGLFHQLIKEFKALNAPIAGADRMVVGEELAVLDLLAVMRAALLPGDDLAVAETLKGPFVGLVDDEADLAPIACGRAEGVSLWDALMASEDPKYAPAKALLEEARARVHGSAFAFLSWLLERRGSDGRSGHAMIARRLGPESREAVDEIVNRALEAERQGQGSLDRFIVDILADDAEIKREMDGAGDRLRIMTVHGAKGLEAPVVILPDTNNSAKSKDTVSFIAAPNGALVVGPGSSKEDDPVSAADRARRKRRGEGESLRLLYVAMTRARDRLVVCAAMKGQGQGSISRGSWYSHVAQGVAALDGLEDDEVAGLAEAGLEALSLQRLGVGRRVDGARAADVEHTALPDWAARPPAAESALPRPVSPSAVLGGGDGARSPLQSLDRRKAERGVTIHGLLEYLAELPEGEREERGRRWLERQPDFDDAARRAMLTEALGVLSDPALAAYLGEGGLSEAPLVGRIRLGGRDQWVEGQVDRLRLAPERTYILDFKTGAEPPASLAAVAPAYVAQMALYREVMRAARPGVPVSCMLVWTQGPERFELTDAMMDGVLAAL